MNLDYPQSACIPAQAKGLAGRTSQSAAELQNHSAYQFCLRDSADGLCNQKRLEILSQALEYIDRHTGAKFTLVMNDLVFINWRTSEPTKNSFYDTRPYKLCDEAGINRFSMHVPRHTYATRAMESGMQPKVLLKLLGHASIQTTMDRYVHVTSDSLAKAVSLFENASPTSLVQKRV